MVGQSPDDVEAGEAALESHKAHLSSWVAEREHAFDRTLEMLRATLATSQSALKSALLINGGAAVALLAFVGSIWNSANKAALPLVADALLYFVYGVLSAAIASGAAYLAQAGYGREFGNASRCIGRSGHIVAFLGVLCSYVWFYYAAWSAFRAVLGG